MCFDKIQARTKEKIEQEIEEKVPEIKKRRQANKPMSSRDLLKARSTIRVAGDPKEDS
jgi:hypothetical protein